MVFCFFELSKENAVRLTHFAGSRLKFVLGLTSNLTHFFGFGSAVLWLNRLHGCIRRQTAAYLPITWMPHSRIWTAFWSSIERLIRVSMIEIWWKGFLDMSSSSISISITPYLRNSGKISCFIDESILSQSQYPILISCA